ncbi:MAG: hypothetical protein IT426_01760 [Pirellulales bacterium]|nr:hypothetical protein [Pirellulales bacterium]
MKLLDSLNRRFGRFAIPNLTLILIFFQVFTYGLQYIRPELLDRIIFVPQKVMEGEWWRLLTFVTFPPFTMPIFVLFFWYLFYLFGSALEATWGTFNYNLYLLLGYLATVGAAFLSPNEPTHNGFLYGSLFLAFAYLYPNFELAIMFVLPVKIKWLALLQWIGYGYAMLIGDWVDWIQVTASVCNFLIFFSPEIVLRARSGRWRMAQQVRKITERDKPRHECSVCKATNVTHPSLRFRYCSKCPGTPCFCEEHLKGHHHEKGSGDLSAEGRKSEIG